MADTGFRWHLRVYDQHKNRFADFVPTRIETARPTQEAISDAHKLSHDTQWNRLVPLQLVPHPDLHHPAAIVTNHGMTNGHLSIEVRAPLAGYAFKRWSVDCTPDHTLSLSPHHRWLRNADTLHGVESAVLAPGFVANEPTTEAQA